MFKSKLVNILRTFTPEEIKRFKEFISSPFHNKNKNVIKLFGALIKFYPNFSSDQLTKEILFKHLYPSKEYNDLVMRILLSDIIKLLEKFIAHSALEKNPNDFKKYLILDFNKRKLFNFLKKELKDEPENGTLNPGHLLNKMFIASQRKEFMILTDHQKGNEVNLIDFGKYLITYFLIKLPELYHELDIHKDLYNIEPDYDFIEKFIEDVNLSEYIEYLEKSNFEFAPVIKLYYYTFISGKHIDKDEYYFEFKKLLEENIYRFDGEEKYNLFIKLESIAIKKIEIGRQEFYNELFDIYTKMLKKNIFTEGSDNFIRIELFRNILFTALRLEKYDWAENFINEYIVKVSPELRDNIYNHSLAHLYYQKKDFKKSIDYLNTVKYDLFVYRADVKILSMKAYYEMKEFESAYSLTDSFNKFISNNKNVSLLFKDRYKSFIKHYNSLLKFSNGKNSDNLVDLEFEIKNDDLVLNKGWFLEKIGELKNSNSK
jgi:hypothetical protein